MAKLKIRVAGVWQEVDVATSWESVSGKPPNYTPTYHTHDDRYYTETEVNNKVYLKSNTDNRSVATIPNDYNGVFAVKGLKSNSVIGLNWSSEGDYSGVLGVRCWSDSSGGSAHEFALTGKGNIYHRHGATDTWNSWKRLAFITDLAHKYHEFNDGEYYFDGYGQRKYLRLFTETASFDQFRFRPISDVEYYNGSTWVTWTGGDSLIKSLLDGRENTGFGLDRTHRQFRFTIQRSGAWPTTALLVLQEDYTGLNHPNTTITIETWNGSAWILKDTANFNSTTTGNTLGTHLKVTSSLHDGIANTRVTVDMSDWAESGSYTTIPLKRLMFLSNYNGGSVYPYSWDYSQVVTFNAVPKVGANNLILEGDARLTDTRNAKDVYSWAKKASLDINDVPTIPYSKLSGTPTIDNLPDGVLKPIALTSGQDLNTITSPGLYSSTSTAIWSSLLNKPTVYPFEGCLEVALFGPGSTAYLKQTISGNRSGVVRSWYRSKTGSTNWSDWREVLNSDEISAWAKAATKPSYNFSEIGSKPTTLSGYGITDAYTKTEVDTKVSAVYRPKGSIPTEAYLYTLSNPQPGDVYNTEDTGMNYAYTDSGTWDPLGAFVDLSPYVKTVQVGSTIHNPSSGTISLPAYPVIPSSLKNPYALTIQKKGTTIDTYDGSAAKTVNITFGFSDLTGTINGTSQIADNSIEMLKIAGLTGTISSINTAINGKANTSHPHAISDITNLQTTLSGKLGNNDKAYDTARVDSKVVKYYNISAFAGITKQAGYHYVVYED